MLWVVLLFRLAVLQQLLELRAALACLVRLWEPPVQPVRSAPTEGRRPIQQVLCLVALAIPSDRAEVEAVVQLLLWLAAMVVRQVL
jgi:hypothetical protein